MSILKQIENQLIEKDIKANLKLINNDTTKQERVYLNINKQFLVYFIEFEKKPFLKVYIQRAENFDFKGVKQSDLETERCKKAKFQILNFLKTNQVEIENIETYADETQTLLAPKSTKKKIEII